MVRLSDIPWVGNAVDRIPDLKVEAWIHGLNYLLRYKALVNDLNSKIEKVEIQEHVVARKAEAEEDFGKIIKNHVVEWQKDVENIKTRVDELSRPLPSWTCLKVLHLPDPVSRFRLGREAAHLAKHVAELTASGEKLLDDEIAHYPPSDHDNKYQRFGSREEASGKLSGALVNEDGYPTLWDHDNKYQHFGSREEAYGKLWEALVNEDGYPILGIYGMAGVGKTRMMKQVVKEATDKKIFINVIRASTHNEIIDVKKSFVNGVKTLIILDDVHDVIPLDNVIPFDGGRADRGTKILLISRKQDVCFRNNCKDPIEIKTLTVGEAWEMFKNTVGTSKIESLQHTSLADKVCGTCAGLPLLITAVGNALKFDSDSSWINALHLLENSELKDIGGTAEKAYAAIQLSIEKLTDAAKTCLFLCSFFPEDANIEIKMLAEMLDDSGESNIFGLIDELKSSSLLLEGMDNIYTVTVHDLIREAARSIVARDIKYGFSFIKCRSWLPDIVDYTTIKFLELDLQGSNVRFPDDLICPDLHTLSLICNNHTQQLSGDMLTNLRSLIVKGTSFSQQQLCIQTLEKLSALILVDCNVSETFLSSISDNLNTLIIWECNLPCPLALPDLKNLRKLELLNRTPVEMVQETISVLSSLEEVNIPGGYNDYDDAIHQDMPELQQIIVHTKRNVSVSSEWFSSGPGESSNSSNFQGS